MTSEHKPAPSFSAAPDIEQRKSLVELGASDERLLAELGAQLPLDQIVRHLRQQLLAGHELHAVGGEPARAERLAAALERYFAELFGGVYDSEYAVGRMKFLGAYRQAGLEGQWYLASHLTFLRIITPHLAQLAEGDEPRLLACFAALWKVIFLDLGIALDAYTKALDTGAMNWERRFQAALESAGDGVALLDEEGGIWHVNHALERMFGYRREELMGNTLTLLLPDRHRLEHDAVIVSHLTSPPMTPDTPRATEGQRKDGSVFPIEYTIGTNQLDGKRLLTCIVRDMSSHAPTGA